MFDNQGNLIPDEVIAFNFENYYDDNEEKHDDEGKPATTAKPKQTASLSCLRTLCF